MTVMGLDLSLTSTGVCVDNKTLTVHSLAVGTRRLADIRGLIMEIVRDYGVDVVAIEGYSYASVHSRAHSIGELGGVIRVALYDEDVAVVTIPPKSRAKFATGKGNANKEEVMSAITTLTGLSWLGKNGNDRCDAWVLREMTLAYWDLSPYSWTSEQLSALDKCDFSAIPVSTRSTKKDKDE